MQLANRRQAACTNYLYSIITFSLYLSIATCVEQFIYHSRKYSAYIYEVRAQSVSRASQMVAEKEGKYIAMTPFGVIGDWEVSADVAFR